MLEALKKIKIKLEERGLIYFYESLGVANLRTWDWKTISEKLQQSSDQLLWKFFFCHEPVEKTALSKEVSLAAVDLLETLGLAKSDNEQIQLKDHYLITYHGAIAFTDNEARQKFGFTDLTQAILCQLPTTKLGRHLSCFSLCGLENVICRRMGYKTAACFSSEKEKLLFEINFALNGYLDIELLPINSLHEAGKFDVITSTPPCLPCPENILLSSTNRGNIDGSEFWKWTLTQATELLNEKGTVEMVFMTMGNESKFISSQSNLDFLEQLPLKQVLSIWSKIQYSVGTPAFNYTIKEASTLNKLSLEEVEAIYSKHYLDNEIDTAYFVRFHGEKQKNKEPLTLVNLANEYYGTWLV
ncbi:MAG: hypothetical protein K1X66_03570 [Verrucomicrobiae bacterium]|nr:hypothetical protein [Verrucomicrobiae bacterium]